MPKAKPTNARRTNIRLSGGRGRLDSVVLPPTMRHFRKKPPSSTTPANNPPSTPTPPVVENIKQQLALFHRRAKDRKALATSSSQLAFSTAASQSRDPTDIVLDEPGSSKESGWRAAYGAARMAVEIANASSDMLLPLKAVVGALSVLLKNYDVSNPKCLTHHIHNSPFLAANDRQCRTDERHREEGAVAE